MFKNLLSPLLVVVAVNACKNGRPGRPVSRSGTPGKDDTDLVLGADTPDVYEVGYS